MGPSLTCDDIFDWLDLIGILCRQPQQLWVHAWEGLVSCVWEIRLQESCSYFTLSQDFPMNHRSPNRRDVFFWFAKTLREQQWLKLKPAWAGARTKKLLQGGTADVSWRVSTIIEGRHPREMTAKQVSIYWRLRSLQICYNGVVHLSLIVQYLKG